MANTPSDVLRGTLDLLILKTLALEPMHGWGISQRIQQISKGVLDVNQGSLRRVAAARAGGVDRQRVAHEREQSAGEVLPPDRRRPSRVGAETENWRRYVNAVNLILKTT